MVERLGAALASLGLPEELGVVAGAALAGCAACGIDFPAALDQLASRAFMIAIQDFQDANTLNVRQLMKSAWSRSPPTAG